MNDLIWFCLGQGGSLITSQSQEHLACKWCFRCSHSTTHQAWKAYKSLGFGNSLASSHLVRISNLWKLHQSLCAQGRSLSTLVWRSPSTLPGWVTIPPPWASRLLWEELFGWTLLFHLRIHFVHWLYPVFLSRTRWVPWRHRLRPLFPFQCHVGNLLSGGILTIKLLHMLCQHMLIWPQRRRLTLSFTYIGAEFPWQNALSQSHQYL